MSTAEKKPSSGGFAKAAQPFACGGLAAMLASACVSPMDVAKTRLQVMAQGAAKGAARPSLLTVMGSIVKNDGITGLYAGCVARTAALPTRSLHAAPRRRRVAPRAAARLARRPARAQRTAHPARPSAPAAPRPPARAHSTAGLLAACRRR